MKAYQLKIVIEGSHPPIWRRIVVPAGMSFSQLIEIFQISMGWHGGHLSMFEFESLGIQIEEQPREAGWSDFEVMDAAMTLIDPLLDEASQFTYIYDFGDDWHHHVTVEDILTNYLFEYPQVVKYKGDIPYEDCGGIYGYYRLLEVLSNPDDPEYEEIHEWAGDPDEVRYDIDDANDELRKYTPDGAVKAWFREEATLEEWGELYQAATVLGQCEPWKRFEFKNLIALAESEKDIVFVSIEGDSGTKCSITVYEGYEGLNDYMMHLSEDCGITKEYATYSQTAMCCCWGNREDLSREQWETVRSLGYRYRGKNKWLHFLSYKKGFFPNNLCREEVLNLTTYLTRLTEAVQAYERDGMEVCFDDGNLYLYYFHALTGTWIGREQRLPFVGYQHIELTVEEEGIEQELQQIDQMDSCWEVELAYLGVALSDKSYSRQINPRICIIADRATGLALDVQMLGPEDEEGHEVANILVDLFFQIGRPKQVRVSNLIMRGYLEDLCRLGDIRLRQVKELNSVAQLLDGFHKMQRGK